MINEKELMLEGISKVIFELSSIAVNKEKWGEETKFRDGVILRSLKNDSKNAGNEQTIYICELQREKLCMLHSIGILGILTELYDEGYCNINIYLMIGTDKKPFPPKFFSEILKIKGLRFFFDFADLSSFTNKKVDFEPLDADDYSPSKYAWILYDKRAKESQNHSEKENMQFPYRLEICLTTDDSSFFNAWGSDYDFIIKDYRFHIARFWKRHCSNLSVVPDSKHPMLTLICQLLNEDTAIGAKPRTHN